MKAAILWFALAVACWGVAVGCLHIPDDPLAELDQNGVIKIDF